MSLNYKEIDVILGELDLSGFFIQQVVQPTFDSIAFFLHKAGISKTVLVCLAQGSCRIHETKSAIPKTEKALRFMEFLRSRIKGCRIESAEQIGTERIILLRLTHADERYNMYIRLWSGAANIIVTMDEEKNGTILDVFYRRPAKGEISGGMYNPLVLTQQKTQNQLKPQKEWEVRTFDELANSADLSFNQKVEKWYTEHAQSLSRVALLEQAEKWYNVTSSRLEAAINRLIEKRESFLHADEWRKKADDLLANAQDKITVKKAQEYYERYKKAVSGLEALERDISISQKNLQKLQTEYEAIKNEQNPLIIQQKIRRQQMPKQQVEKKYPGLRYEVDGWTIFVGRTAEENDELLRHFVRGQDMWLHTRDWQGGYVFIKNRAGKSVPQNVLLDAANLALYFSKGRKAQKADLYYTHVKYLRRAKNAPKGTVLPTNEKNIFIELDMQRLQKLEENSIST